MNLVPDFDPQTVMYRCEGQRLRVKTIKEKVMHYEVKNVKSFRGMEGHGYNASLYRDGNKVALIMDEGNGGEVSAEWVDRNAVLQSVQSVNYKGESYVRRCTPEEAILVEYMKGKKVDLGQGLGEVDLDLGMFVGQLMDAYENAKRFNRICKTKTLFRVNGDEQGSYRQVPQPFSKKVKYYIVGKYGDKVEVILNEQFGQVAA